MIDFRIPFGKWVESSTKWIEDNLDWLLTFLGDLWNLLYDSVNWLFTTPSAIVVIIVMGLLALIARGWKFGLGTVLGLLFIIGVDQWDNAMDTISLVIVSAFLALVVAIPLGILAARNKTVSAVVKPIMDFLQTMPAFVYLIPAIAFFGIGVAPGIFATVLFSLAPGVRLTELGIRTVDSEVVEAGQAFGASPRRILRQIQLPLAMPSIMAGVNQVIMLSLSMVVIAGMVGAGGLGGDVARAVSALDIAIGAEAGMSVVILAIVLDRFTGAFGNRRGRALMARWFSQLSGGGESPTESTAGKDTERILAEHSGNRRQPGR
ncbi:ABC transporter permease subunit [Demequina sp. TTPB684]|uniref:ABC transporter permease n=1 Tax=unclassified Demequina TaxID=2620311 RepID=UPI001CF405F8|nr:MULTISPECIES: ABC transporter permease subunit [unclassified Demequina]MCB2411950.1 ABC transporter permease subunit [Demequina sp. TTPB684]UPU87150.1 ABC transporter permease subunit [Demequina sp. TMPB413]